MTEDRKRTPKTHPYPSGLDGLDAHLLKDLWGVTPDQLAVARGMPRRCDAVAALLRMGRADPLRRDPRSA